MQTGFRLFNKSFEISSAKGRGRMASVAIAETYVLQDKDLIWALNTWLPLAVVLRVNKQWRSAFSNNANWAPSSTRSFRHCGM
jgi:hypothetical protein